MIKYFIAFLAVLTLSNSVCAQEIPESTRSRASNERVRHRLLHDLSSKGLNFGRPIFIRIFKESMELELWVQDADNFVLFRKYDVCAASGDLGPKLRKGDNQSPEGFYYVTPMRLNPFSSYHLSFNLGYPNTYDRFHKRTGGALMVHGDCVSIGCYAMTDAAIEEIYALADAAFRGGQSFFRVHVFPFRMGEERLQQAHNSKWIDFWRNLQSGYDYFESQGRPPNVKVAAGKYTFQE